MASAAFTSIRSAVPAPDGLEPHYTVEEIAAAWHLAPNTIRALFENEPGVLRIARPEKMHKGPYVTVRIPKSVTDRVHERMTRKGK